MILDEHIKRTDILLEAFPYIKRFLGKIVVIKYGGSLMINDENDHFGLSSLRQSH